MAIKWRKLLSEDYPSLADRSKVMDEEDSFDISTSRRNKKQKREAS